MSSSPQNTLQATEDLLFELGCEELPPKSLNVLSHALCTHLVQELDQAGIAHGEAYAYCSPRRLAVCIEHVTVQQEGKQQMRKGPALVAAMKDGKPTPALLGFARSCGVEPEQLQIEETDKGSWYVHSFFEKGKVLQDLLADMIHRALANLPIAKRMRWADRNEEFVRPAHWVVLMLGQCVVPETILGIVAGNTSRGHRIHAKAPIVIAHPRDYAALLKQQGFVWVDAAERRAAIEQQVSAAAQNINGIARYPQELLDEVTALVEYPVVLTGQFDARFLEVPQEALISTMQDNQKYFPVVDAQGKLMPYFIFVANLQSQDPAQVVHGNERVIRPRFADAEFFWREDLKHPLTDHLAGLEKIVFQQKLGSVADKTRRVQALAEWMAQQLATNSAEVSRAALLAKCDLLTQMVQEFPELQGTMGRYYATANAEPEEVALALEQHYRPRFAGDQLPERLCGQIVALADRIDTLVGIFSIGQAPTGAKDPFGLRRAALGVIRLLVEIPLALDLAQLIKQAGKGFPTLQIENAAVFQFILERTRGYFLDQGIAHDSFDAVLETRPTHLFDMQQRLQALQAFRSSPELASLAAANKRASNLLRKTENATLPELQQIEWQEAAEKALFSATVTACKQVEEALAQLDYPQVLRSLSLLQVPVDQFFDQVMVMVEDPQLRDARLALLQEVCRLSWLIADLAKLQE